MSKQEIKVVCAWCGEFLRGDQTASQVSHGMCQACHAAETALVATYAARGVTYTPATPADKAAYEATLDRLHGGTSRASLIEDPELRRHALDDARTRRRQRSARSRREG